MVGHTCCHPLALRMSVWLGASHQHHGKWLFGRQEGVQGTQHMIDALQAGQMWGDGAARSAHGTGPGPLTKAIVFSQFWMHIQLTAAHLLSHDVHVSVLKRDLSPRAKAEALDVFQVIYPPISNCFFVCCCNCLCLSCQLSGTARLSGAQHMAAF